MINNTQKQICGGAYEGEIVSKIGVDRMLLCE
jgi:hypothetical protein